MIKRYFSFMSYYNNFNQELYNTYGSVDINISFEEIFKQWSNNNKYYE